MEEKGGRERERTASAIEALVPKLLDGHSVFLSRISSDSKDGKHWENKCYKHEESALYKHKHPTEDDGENVTEQTALKRSVGK